MSSYMKWGENAIELPFNDPQRQSQIILSTLEQPEQISSLIKNGISTASQFHWDPFLDRLANILF